MYVSADKEVGFQMLCRRILLRIRHHGVAVRYDDAPPLPHDVGIGGHKRHFEAARVHIGVAVPLSKDDGNLRGVDALDEPHRIIVCLHRVAWSVVGNVPRVEDEICTREKLLTGAHPRTLMSVSVADNSNLHRVPHIFFKRLAISIAAIAESAPLLPAFVPARSIACSMFSVVTTPKIVGTPVWRPTCATPFETSLHT